MLLLHLASDVSDIVWISGFKFEIRDIQHSLL